MLKLDSLPKPNRKFILEMRCFTRSGGKSKRSHIYLFNDSIIVKKTESKKSVAGVGGAGSKKDVQFLMLAGARMMSSLSADSCCLRMSDSTELEFVFEKMIDKNTFVSQIKSVMDKLASAPATNVAFPAISASEAQPGSPSEKKKSKRISKALGAQSTFE